MKIAYLGKIQLSDVDLSYLHEAQKLSEITYFMEVNPRFKQGPAYNIKQIYPKSGIFKAIDIYPEIKHLQGFINIDKFYVVNTCGKYWMFKSFWTYFLLLKFLLKQKFDIIHLVWPPNIYEFIIYVLRHKMLLTVHDPFPHTNLNTFIVKLRRNVAFWLIPHFIILNKAQRQDFLDFYGLPSQRVFNSRLSCYTYLRKIGTSKNYNVNGRYILFAGKISPYKGLDYLLPAMEYVHLSCPDCRIIIAGGGEFFFDISHYQTLDYIEIRNRFIPDTEMVTLIQNCAFMVCPYTDATQSGVVMSAFAFNKPVIATNVGGLPEMVKHKRYGLIIKKKDIKALAENITTLWTNQSLVETFSYYIKEDYNTGNLSWKRIAEDLYKDYSTITQ